MWSSIFNTDQVVPRSHGSVLHLVALWDLLALHFHFGRTLNSHSQGPGTGLCVVNDELRLGTYNIAAEPSFLISHTSHVTSEPTDKSPTCCASFQSGSIDRDQTRVSGLSRLPDPNLEGTSWNVSAIEFDINSVETVLPGDEADGVFIWRSSRRTPSAGSRHQRSDGQTLTDLVPAR